MVLTASDWDKIQNLHLQFLSTKTTGERWISYLIRKLWDTDLDVGNHRNHTLHYTYGSMKFEILRLI